MNQFPSTDIEEPSEKRTWAWAKSSTVTSEGAPSKWMGGSGISAMRRQVLALTATGSVAPRTKIASSRVWMVLAAITPPRENSLLW